MCQALKQYEATDLPDRADEYRVAVFKLVGCFSSITPFNHFYCYRCLENVRVKMASWAHKSWLHMLLHQGDFELDISDCNASITDCLAIMMVSTRPWSGDRMNFICTVGGSEFGIASMAERRREMET